MPKQVAVILENDQFYPDSDAAIHFAELANEPFLSAKTLTTIEKLGGFKIIVRPFCTGLGHAAVTNNVIKLPMRAKQIFLTNSA